MTVSIVGAGAFGTALAITLARAGQRTVLWARDGAEAQRMRKDRVNRRYLPDAPFPEPLSVTGDLAEALGSEALLLAVPMQSMAALLAALPPVPDRLRIVACAKGIDLTSGLSATALLARDLPSCVPAILSGPSFAADIARGLPTALTIACTDDAEGEVLQHLLSGPTLRLYRTTDTLGVELGGALKNVIAIAAGLVVGAGLGDSARAALVTRGFAEMMRVAVHLGARPETLSGLSGLGDLILTCTSLQSRNFRYGVAIGAGDEPPVGQTVEGVATARAVAALARRRGIDMPVSETVSAVIDRRVTLGEAVASLLNRPLRKE